MATLTLAPSPLLDLIPAYQDAVAAAARGAGVPQSALDAARAAARAAGPPSDFAAAAAEVSRSIAALATFIRATRADYATSGGAVSEAERDRIEAEAGGFVRACNGHVAALERAAAVGGGRGGASASTSSPSATITAHRHGVALILAERLAGVSGVFDRARAARYGAAAAARAAWEARLRGAAAAAAARGGGGGGAASPPPRQPPPPQPSPYRPGSAVAAAKADAAGQIAAARAAAAAGGAGTVGPPLPSTTTSPHQQQRQQQEQQALAHDSAALFAELHSLGTDVARAEATAREVAALSQAFSAQVASQAATIEGLYTDALAAVERVGRGNASLRKAVAAGAGGRRWTFYALVIAAVAILLADWVSS